MIKSLEHCSNRLRVPAAAPADNPPRLRRSGSGRRGAVLSLMEVRRGRPVSWHGDAGPDIEIHKKPIESDNPFLNGDLINQNETCWMALTHRATPQAEPTFAKSTVTVKLRRSTRKRENDENSLNCFKSPARKRRPTSWIGVSLASQSPKPYTSKAEADTHPSLIGKSWMIYCQAQGQGQGKSQSQKSNVKTRP